MGSPHRQSGFTNFTLDRPAAFVRRAQVVLGQRTEPWFARGEATRLRVASWLKRARAHTRDSVQRSVMHTRATLREDVVPRLATARTATVATITHRTQSTRAAVAGAVGPRLESVRAATSRTAVRGLMWVEETWVHTIAPWLERTRQNATEKTIHFLMWAQTTYDHVVLPWAIDTRASLRERLPSAGDVMAAVRARREEGFRVPLWLAISLIVVAVLLTQAVAHQNGERRYEAMSRQLAQVFRSEQESADIRARETLARESEEMHRMFGAVMTWSMQNALARKSYDELDQYLAQIGKNDRVKLALLADLNGKVVAATDQRLKGTNFAQYFPQSLLSEVTMQIQSADEDLKRLVMPIERYGVRLGTAVLVYAAPRASTN